jgi:hypothetical protein
MASLMLQSTERGGTGVFVRMHTGIVLAADKDWDQSAVESALVDFIRSGTTASQLGVAWKSKGDYRQLDGLWPLTVAVRGKYFMVSDDAILMEGLLTNVSRKPEAKPAIFIAGFRHASERNNFVRFFGLIDGTSQAKAEFPAISREPQFFSGNVGSLSDVLSVVSAENVVVRRDGNKELETVIYAWAQ